MILKKCPKCSTYNLTSICRKCKTQTKDAHYKFINVKNPPKKFKKISKR
jgi:rRNA maturation protein Nop10